MQHHQPYSGRGGRHPTYHSNRHRSGPATSYNTTSYPNYYRQYIPSNQGINPPPSKRRRAEPSTWHPDSLPRQIGEGSSSGGTSRPREEEPGFMSKDEIDRCSPSRKDGIDSLMEARLRQSYCSYLKNLGLRLALPQSTIATAIVMCHRFYLRRSHACHDRFLVATAALFLASKSEESPCLLNTVLRVSFEVSQSPEFAFVPYMIHGQNWFDQYRERVIEVEQLILTTLDFELEVKHPYGPLNSGLNKLGFSRTVLYNLAWNLVTEGMFLQEKCDILFLAGVSSALIQRVIFAEKLRSSLWLQFKPHHIAAGAAYLAAKLLHYDITLYPSFWQDFQTTPYIVQDVVQQLMELL